MVKFRLPDGRIVAVHSDVARCHGWITYQLESGAVVVAVRAR